jgi:hypothetical protein
LLQSAFGVLQVVATAQGCSLRSFWLIFSKRKLKNLAELPTAFFCVTPAKKLSHASRREARLTLKILRYQEKV